MTEPQPRHPMYWEQPSVSWQTIEAADRWLDGEVAQEYKDQPLGQDWARLGKVVEEMGEAIAQLILFTGQNPRKGQEDYARLRMLEEMGDVAVTALLCIQHFTKDTLATGAVLEGAQIKLDRRIPDKYRGSVHALRVEAGKARYRTTASHGHPHHTCGPECDYWLGSTM